MKISCGNRHREKGGEHNSFSKRINLFWFRILLHMWLAAVHKEIAMEKNPTQTWLLKETFTVKSAWTYTKAITWLKISLCCFTALWWTEQSCKNNKQIALCSLKWKVFSLRVSPLTGAGGAQVCGASCSVSAETESPWHHSSHHKISPVLSGILSGCLEAQMKARKREGGILPRKIWVTLLLYGLYS